MSYISGFMLGAAIAKNLRQALGVESPRYAKKTSARPPFALASSAKGRRRYRAAKISGELAAMLQGKLAKLPYLRKVEVNPLTGSILFEYDEKDAAKIDELAKVLKNRIFGSAAPAIKKTAPQNASEAGELTRSIRGTLRDFSEWIRRNTGGIFDAGSLAALLFALRGLRKMIITKQYPSGTSMLWWAASLMRGWRTL